MYAAPPGSPVWKLPEEAVVTSTEERFLYDPSAPRRPARRRGAGGREGHASTTAPRSGPAGRRRCSTPTVPARSWTCRSSRSCPPASTTGTASGAGATGIPHIHAPRLRDVVRLLLRSPDVQLRPYPVAAEEERALHGGQRPRRAGPGLPAVAALHGLRHARRLAQFDYRNTHPFRTDLAVFRARASAPARGSAPARRAAPSRRPRALPAGLRRRASRRVPLRPVGAPRAAVRRRRRLPALKMVDRTAGKGASAVIAVRVLRPAQAHERGAGRGRAGEAAAVPGASSAPGRVRRRRAARTRPG